MTSVDILIPTYNRAEYLKQALDSIRTQTFTDWRVVIYDDGSTDNTPDIVADFMKGNPNVIYIRSPFNHGVGYARNVLLDNIVSKYALWQDSDDISSPERIENMLTCIKVSKADICFSDLNFFSDNARPNKLRHILKVDITKYKSREGLVGNMCFATGIFKRSLKRFRFREDIKKKEDVNWLTQLINAKKKFGYMPKPLYYARRHAGRLTYSK